MGEKKKAKYSALRPLERRFFVKALDKKTLRWDIIYISAPVRSSSWITGFPVIVQTL